MARIRTIKPEFWTDEKVVELDFVDRLLFIGLWNFADDQGYMPYRVKRIKMQVFPGDSVDVEAGLQRLHVLGLIRFYETDFGVILHCSRWDRHQKVSNPSKPRYAPSDLRILKNFPDSSRGLASSLDSYPAEVEGKGREVEGKGINTSSETDDAPPDDPIVDQLCDYLADRIESNGSKRPPVTKKWRDACRRMLDRDQRTPDQIRAAIDWCQTDDFWRANVMSMPKLREKFDTLRLQAQRRRGGSGGTSPPRIATADQRLADGMALSARLAAEESQSRLELEA